MDISPEKEKEGEKGILNKLFSFISRNLGITGKAVDNKTSEENETKTNKSVKEVEINDSAEDYEISYEMPSPQKFGSDHCTGRVGTFEKSENRDRRGGCR